MKIILNIKIRPLTRLNNYYTVENLVFNENKEDKLNTKELQIKSKLVNIINQVIKIFGKVDFNVEYVKNNDEMSVELYLSPPLSLTDIEKLETLSNNLNFYYNAISDKKNKYIK